MTGSPPPPLPKRADFLRAAARGQKRAYPGLVAQTLLTSPDQPVRLGLTASRKVGNAVIRNRARRRLREAARLALAERRVANQPCTGFDLVLIARHDTGAVPFAALRQTLADLLDRANPPAPSPAKPGANP
ncbi:MAG: ribonuclease P protein component [Acidiphilium sp. 21-60-14]|nr:MAG: ribonuclease P protein component [Acidiphilium sp. 21-60-14]OYV92035.1 MAG: ribonuclease P protein component [Acidiphilium sp. 37-60-79]OZB39336.1 MAG: ribonuclease P protein component [Acidiphilium sp. 34-60-192]